MKKKVEEWLSKLGEIIELQGCLTDVLENCIHKDEVPYYAVSLVNNIKQKTAELYDNMDDFTVEDLKKLEELEEPVYSDVDCSDEE